MKKSTETDAQGNPQRRVGAFRLTSQRVLIVIPTYNEIENLKLLLDRVRAEIAPMEARQEAPEVHILVVDDGSPDGTGDLADDLATKDARLHVLHRPRKMGLGSAYVQGFRYGLERGFDWFLEMDCDFSHDPKYLPFFFKEFEQNDVVIGSRYVSGGAVVNWGLGRKILSRGGSIYARLCLGMGIADLTGGFNAWKSSVLKAINLDSIESDGYSFQIEMKYKAWKQKFRIKEIPIVFEDRRAGHSKMNKKIVMEAIVRVAHMRWAGSSASKL